MHRRLVLDIREQTYPNHCKDVDNQEQKPAHIQQGRHSVNECGKNDFHLLETTEKLEHSTYSKRSDHLSCST
jgi:hypothetical protein